MYRTALRDESAAFVCAGTGTVLGSLSMSRVGIPGEATMGRRRLKRPRVVLRERRSRARNSSIRMEDSSIGYVPSEDDRPSGMSEIPTELTLSQQLLMKQYEEQVERMSKAECQDLALEIARQMIVKDNILRTMLKKDFDTGVEPPEPDSFLEGEESGGK